jgi:hypothetical protein
MSVERLADCEQQRMRTKAKIEVDTDAKSFATGLLPELIAALRQCRPGYLVAVVSSEEGLGTDLEVWCRFTRNTLVDTSVEAAANRRASHPLKQRPAIEKSRQIVVARTRRSKSPIPRSCYLRQI